MKESPIVLGIDPGFSVTGFGVLVKNGQKIQVLDYGALKLPVSESLSKRIGIFHNYFTEKIKAYGVSTIALETPFLGKNAQNFLKLGYLRGILYLLAEQHSLDIVELAPTQIKQSITGFGKAEKEQVARVLMRFFPGLVMPSKLDITDALAISLCGIWAPSKKTILSR